MVPPERWDLRRHARAAPGRIAVVCGEERWTYGQLEAWANRMAAGLRTLGLRRGDHVAACIANRPELLALAWAAWRCGVYLTPMATSLTRGELRYLVEDSSARAVVAEASVGERVESLPALLAGVHWLALRGAVSGFTPLQPLLDAQSPEPVDDEPPGGLMMYTSGTTGRPKGVVRPLLSADWRGTPPFAADLIALFGVGGEDVRYLSTAPLYHAAPLRFALAVTAGGGTAWIMDRFDARAALVLLREHAITHSQWVPAMFQRLLALPAEERAAHRAPAHRCAIHGAAPCPTALKRAMIDWWGPILLEYYSGTEGVGLTLNTSEEALTRPGSVGRARKGQVHVVDDAGRELPPGQRGRIFFSGVAPFAYHGAAAKTAGRTLPSGWQGFGDIGWLDADGYLYLTDREDDMLISGGVNVYPQEIEAVIREVPCVVDCAVVGVPDDRFGEAPVAFVECTASAQPADLEPAIRAATSAKLARQKHPREIRFVERLPRSATGKLLRRVLREQGSAT